MGKYTIIVFVLLIAACSTEKKAGNESSPLEKEIPSPRREASGNANGVNITVDYGSPAVRGRKIWGGLEKYGRVWRAGANETTSISFDQDVLVNGEPIPAGKYALFIMPKENQDWVVIFNTDWDEWGAFRYTEENDIMRLAVTPEWENNIHERLEYFIESGKLNFKWEKVRLSMDIQPSE